MKILYNVTVFTFLIAAVSCKKEETSQKINIVAASVHNFAATAVTTSYYVDNVNGNDNNSGTSSATAWKTITKVNSVTFHAGNKILFKAGGSWKNRLHPLGSGTSGNPIIIDSYGTGARPEIDGAGVANGTICLTNQQYWELRNLEITNFNPAEVSGKTLETWEAGNTKQYANVAQPAQFANKATAKIGVLILAQDKGQVNHIYLHNLEVHGVNGYINQADEDSKYNGGVCFRITGNATITWFNDVLIDECNIHDVDRTGLWSESTWSKRTFTANTNWKPSLNLVIRNNSFANTGANALIVRVADRPLMEHNLFDHCAIKASGNAAFNFNTDNAIWQYNECRYTKANVNDHDAGGIDADYETKNTIIQYNFLHDNDFGFLITGGNGVFNDNTVVRYNIFKRDGNYAHPSDGKFVLKIAGKATNTFVYNNTIYVSTGQTNTQIIKCHFWSVWPSKIKFNNNIFDNSGKTSSYSLGGSTGYSFDYNAYYKTKAANQPGQTHSITGDIKFADTSLDDPDGFKLKSGSVALLSGTLISNNGGLDYFGNKVSATAKPNVGAYNGPGA